MTDKTTLRQIAKTPRFSVPPAETDQQHYQREVRRLLIETEQQRREILVLRKDLSSALTQLVRASSAIDHSEALLLPNGPMHPDVLAQRRANWSGAVSAFREIDLGRREDIISRIDALNQPIPEYP